MYNLLSKEKFKTFHRHPLVDRVPMIPSTQRIDGGQFRIYRTPDGNEYPSVTSIFSIEEKPEIESWRNSMGHEEADRWTRRAGVRGTFLHEMCEFYVQNELREHQDKYNFISVNNFLPVKKVIDDRIDNIVACELQIFSDKLICAGTIDLIAEWDGRLCIIDYKTSNQHKYRSQIKNYFMQGAAYSYMANEHLGTSIEDIIIMMIVDGGKILIFEEKTKDHFKDFLKRRVEFKERFGL